MSKTSNFLAFDFGAESGRSILGILQDNRIELKELHRFPTGMMQIHNHFRWNIYRLYEEVLKGMQVCAQAGINPASIGIDTWGVDFGLFMEDGSMLDAPFCYRDSRTDHAMEEVFTKISREEIYKRTGIQFMQLNSLYQLHAAQRDNPKMMSLAKDLLFIPDIFHFFLTGIRKTEFSFATTSQLYNPILNNWDPDIFKAIGVPSSLMQNIIAPGTVLGNIYPQLAKKTGLLEIPVVAVATHDTGSAIAAVPAEGKNWAYISSGTWSLMGIESKTPLISDKSLSFNMTNEGGVDHSFRVLKNIMGLWLLQQSKSAWQAKNYSYTDMVKMASQAKAFQSFVDPDAGSFLNPADMPAAIRQFCKDTHQYIPQNEAEVVLTIFESLALKYRYTLDQLRELANHPIERIYIIGGGVQNELLCQFTANACGVEVITGPSEGTALGNILVQARAMGYLKSLEDIRSVVRNSFESKRFVPIDQDNWNKAYEKFKSLVK